jgi:hypothetical protein
MATSYTTLLGLALPATGELSGTWGDTVNNYLSTYVDSAVAGSLAISLTGDVTLTKTTGSSLGSTSSQYAILNVTPSASTWTITVPAASKIYVINNLSGTYTFTFKATGQTGVTIATSEKCVVAFNGTDFVKIATTGVSGVLPIANGGTNASTASITSFNNITGYSASGATGTTTTNLVFSTSPTLVTPVLGTPSSGTLSSCTVDGTNSVGYLNIPQNAQTGSYTTVLSDAGKHIYHASGAGAATYTIAANASVPYVLGTVISFVNLSTTSISIAINSDTMYLGNLGTSGTRTLAQYGVANALKVTSTVWIITGTALT